MKDWSAPELAAAAIVAAIAVLVTMIVLVAVYGTSRTDASKACLEHGYPKYQMEDGTVFCTRLVDGTDEVVPLSKLQARPEATP